MAGPSRDPEEPAAHVSDYLALLPSGPDAVRRLRLHRVRAAPRPVTTPLGVRCRPETSQSIAGSKTDQGRAPTPPPLSRGPGKPACYTAAEAARSSWPEAAVLRGEMSERLKEHAWKLSGLGAPDCYRRRPTRATRATCRQRCSLNSTPYHPIFLGDQPRLRHNSRHKSSGVPAGDCAAQQVPGCTNNRGKPFCQDMCVHVGLVTRPAPCRCCCHN